MALKMKIPALAKWTKSKNAKNAPISGHSHSLFGFSQKKFEEGSYFGGGVLVFGFLLLDCCFWISRQGRFYFRVWGSCLGEVRPRV